MNMDRLSKMMRYRVVAFLLVLLLTGTQVGAQDNSGPPAEPVAIPADEFDRGTPLRSAEGFLAAVDVANYEAAAEYLDLRNLRGEARDLTGAQLARRLFVIINRADWVDVGDLVDDPAGRSHDNLPQYRDSIGVVRDGGNDVRLLMQKVPRGDGVAIWKVSNASVSLIPKLYATYGYAEWIENLRRALPTASFLGYELFKWVIVLGVGLLLYAAVFLAALMIRRVLGDPQTPSHRRVFRFLMLPLGTWIVVISMNSVSTSLGRGVTAEAVQQFSPVPILVTVWMIFVGINLLRDIYSNRLEQRNRSSGAVFLQPASNAIKLLIGVAAVLLYLDKLGINITTVLAGLGVGGIAVALALQRPMEDVFGAITLYTQQPIRVGDFCRIGSETGTVEEISLRTTRIRTLADTVIAIPNSRLASEAIDNISARSKILFRPSLRLRYDTTPEQLQQILAVIRALFVSHERILQDNHRVRFIKIDDDALVVELYAYLNTKVWSEYLGLAEELNINILEIVAQAGTSLSPPARTLHIEQRDAGVKAAIV